MKAVRVEMANSTFETLCRDENVILLMYIKNERNNALEKVNKFNSEVCCTGTPF